MSFGFIVWLHTDRSGENLADPFIDLPNKVSKYFISFHIKSKGKRKKSKAMKNDLLTEFQVVMFITNRRKRFQITMKRLKFP